MRSKLLGFRLAAVILGLGVALFIMEISVRLFFPEYLWKYRDFRTDCQLEGRLGWVQKPNLNLTSRVAHGSHSWIVRFRTNPDGLTPVTARRLKSPGLIRIMIFGDSTVVGRDVPQDRTINAQLEQQLRSKGFQVEVINAGVEAYSTDQVLLRIQQLAPLYHPDIVAYGLCFNDFGPNVLRETQGMSKPMFILREDKNGSLEELQELPPDLKHSRLLDFSIGPRSRFRALALYRFLWPQLVTLRARFMGWEHRNLLGLAPEIYYRPEELERIDWKLFTALLKQMEMVSRENGSQFFFYSAPQLFEVWQPFIHDTERRRGLKPGQYDRQALEKRLLQVAKSHSIAFYPLIDYFMANQARGPFHLLPKDPHNNPAGYELMAEAIAQYLLESGFIRSILALA